MLGASLTHDHDDLPRHVIPARVLLDEVDERLAELEYVNGAGYLVTGIEALTQMLDTHRSTAEIVAENYETLQPVIRRETFDEVVAWVDAVRPRLLADLAYDMDHAADWMGANGGYRVTVGRMVTNGGAAERIVLEAVESERMLAAAAAAPATVSPPTRARASRSSGRRRTGARRSSRGSPGRPADDEPDPARPGGCLGVGAAA
jgi:hypothetical protein